MSHPLRTAFRPTFARSQLLSLNQIFYSHLIPRSWRRRRSHLCHHSHRRHNFRHHPPTALSIQLLGRIVVALTIPPLHRDTISLHRGHQRNLSTTSQTRSRSHCYNNHGDTLEEVSSAEQYCGWRVWCVGAVWRVLFFFRFVDGEYFHSLRCFQRD